MIYGTPDQYQSVAYGPLSARLSFVRKVYGMFFVSILISVLTGALSWQPGMIEFAVQFSGPIRLICFLMILVMAWGKNRPGLNLILLYTFSALMGFAIGPLFWIFQQMLPGVPMQAAGLTTAVFGGLTAYVMVTKQDFNWLGGFLFVSLLALIIGGLLMVVFGVAPLYTFYCIAGVLIFSGFVLYDTSNIMTRLRHDEAAIGALDLYLDFLNLLKLIMFLLAGSRRN